MPNFKNIIFFLLLFAIAFQSIADGEFPYGKGKVKHRISLGPVVSFYKNHPQMTTGTKAKAGFNFCYKSEILLGRKTNLMIGLEFMSQGLTFKGYYADSGYTYIYDKSYAYTHEIRFNELQLPIALKVAFNTEKDSPFTSYFFGGIGARYILKSYVVITNDSLGTSPYDGKETIGFEHHMISKGFNMFYHGGLGIQKNFRTTGRAFFIEFTYKYGLSRIHYTGHKNSNDLNIKNNNLAITVGLRI